MRTITFHCEGPYDRETDRMRGTCTSTATIGWDDPSPTGWVYTMMGCDVCPECHR